MRPARGARPEAPGRDGRWVLCKEEAARGARPGAPGQGNSCAVEIDQVSDVLEWADGSQPLRQTVGRRKMGSRLTVKVS